MPVRRHTGWSPARRDGTARPGLADRHRRPGCRRGGATRAGRHRDRTDDRDRLGERRSAGRRLNYAVSADGQALAIGLSVFTPGGTDLTLTVLRGPDLRPSAQRTFPGHAMVITVIDHLLQWSPDDRYLALQMGGAGDWRDSVHVLDAQTLETVHTTNDSGLMGSQSWSHHQARRPGVRRTPHPPPRRRTPGTPALAARRTRRPTPPAPDPRPARQPPPRPRPAPDPQTRPAPHRRSHHRRRTHRSRHPHHRPGPPRPPHHLPRLGTPRRPRADIGLSTRHRRRPDLPHRHGARTRNPQWKPGPGPGGRHAPAAAVQYLKPCWRPYPARWPTRERANPERPAPDGAQRRAPRCRSARTRARLRTPRLLRATRWGAPPHPASSPIALL